MLPDDDAKNGFFFSIMKRNRTRLKVINEVVYITEQPSSDKEEDKNKRRDAPMFRQSYVLRER